MKKLIAMAAVAFIAGASHAAAVGWNLASGSADYKGNAYAFFLTSGNDATSAIADVVTILAAGGDYTSATTYMGGGTLTTAAGGGSVSAPSSGKTVSEGTYTGFFVLFDSATPVADASNYVVVSGASTLTKDVAATTAQVIFASGNASSIVSNADNWKSYGSVPEPTSGLLMLLGMAGLALRRKRA